MNIKKTLRTGIEPVTLRLTVVRYYQLSYQSKMPTEGFEPPRPKPGDLKSLPLDLLGHVGVIIKNKSNIFGLLEILIFYPIISSVISIY